MGWGWLMGVEVGVAGAGGFEGGRGGLGGGWLMGVGVFVVGVGGRVCGRGGEGGYLPENDLASVSACELHLLQMGWGSHGRVGGGAGSAKKHAVALAHASAPVDTRMSACALRTQCARVCRARIE